jgi:hypothetical protein
MTTFGLRSSAAKFSRTVDAVARVPLFPRFRYLPRAGEQSDIPSQQMHQPRPAQTKRQPDIAQFARERASLEQHPPKPLGNWRPAYDANVPKARTASRLVHVGANEWKLIVPENPYRSFLVVGVYNGATAFITFGKAAVPFAGIPVLVNDIWPKSLGGGAIPIDEVWASVGIGTSADLIIFEGMPTLTGPNYDDRN